MRKRTAGRALRTEYHQRLKLWQRRHRRSFLIAFGVPAAILFVTLILFTPGGGMRTFIGFVFGMFVGAGLWASFSPPSHIERLQVGSWGEEWTEEELNKLRREGWFAVHDRTLGRGNIDHIAVSPSGVVFVLDSKNLDGAVEIDGDVLQLRRHEGDGRSESFPYLARTVSRDSARLHDEIRAATDIWAWVYPVVVLWAAFGEAHVPEQTSRGVVAYVRGDVLPDWLRAQELEQPFRDGERDRVIEWLAELPAATWTTQTG